MRLYASNLSSRYVLVIPFPCFVIVIWNPQENFDVRQFLSSTLEESPPMPNPIVVTMEGEPRFKGVRHPQLLGQSLGLIFLQRW